MGAGAGRWRGCLADAGREGDLREAEHRWGGVGAHEPVAVAVTDAGQLEPIEIAQQVCPLGDAGLSGEIVKMFLHEQGKERAEHVAANGGITGYAWNTLIDQPWKIM